MDCTKFMVSLLLIQLLGIQNGFGFKWTSPIGRSVYGENKKSITLTWEVDLGDKKFYKAIWKTGDIILIFVKEDGSILLRDPATSDKFGVVTIILDSGYINSIEVEITAKDLSTIKDIVTIKYISKPPSIDESKIDEKYDVIENTNSSKDIEMMMKVQGGLKPNIFWMLGGRDVKTMAGFTVSEKVDQVETVFHVTSSLRIAQLLPKHNGVLEVVGKYGNYSDASPYVNKSAIVNVKYGPKNIQFSHNITNSIMYDAGYILLRCEVNSNPTAHFQFKEGSNILYEGVDSYTVDYIGNFHHKRKLIYICIANNSVGHVISDVLQIQVVNGTLLAKRVADEDVDWWVYFGVAVAVGLLLFLGVASILWIMRRRMRSLNLRHDIDKARMRQDLERRTIPRTNGASHVYDMNERAKKGTATQIPQIDQSKKRPPLAIDNEYQNNNGRINEGFDISMYDTIGNRVNSH